jgi:hypothetical protein
VSKPLAGYWLPDAATGDRLQVAFDSHLAIWRLPKGKSLGSQAAAALTALMPFRAVLGPFNSTAHIGGASGTYKTSIARLSIQHFAAGISGVQATLPASWLDSACGLQAKLHECGDSLLLIDDLKADLKYQELIETANLILESQGNLTGRDTMRRDRNLNPTLNPRGSVISTGEADPTVRSALARGLVIEIGSAADVDFSMLVRLAQAGDDGLLAGLMSSYLQWVAARRAEILAEHKRLTVEIRGKLGDFPGVHPRHPNAAAELLAAYEIFIRRFAVEKGLIAKADADACLASARRILIDLVAVQVEVQEESKPGRQFCEYIGAPMRAGKLYLRNKLNPDVPPEYPEACGWESHGSPQARDWQKPRYTPCGGFVDDKEKIIYLDKKVAIGIANAWAKQNGETLAFTSVSLGRDLIREGLCLPFQEGSYGKQRAASNQSIHGQKSPYFRIPRDHIIDPKESIRSNDCRS